LGEQYLHVECEYEDSSVKNTCNLLATWKPISLKMDPMDPMDPKTIIHNDMFLNTFSIMNTIQREYLDQWWQAKYNTKGQ
jgi:hypothetical protein